MTEEDRLVLKAMKVMELAYGTREPVGPQDDGVRTSGQGLVPGEGGVPDEVMQEEKMMALYNQAFGVN